MTNHAETRPDLDSITTSAELRRWYWTKAELYDACRHMELRRSGGKFTLLDRIAHFLDTGEQAFPGDKAPKVTSDFDWHAAPLSSETVITDSYRNTQNVRRFFKAEIGPKFTFNTTFMAWMKASAGKTLADAVIAYREIAEATAQPGHKSNIAAHNQFNQYTRDFLADNPHLGMKEVRHFWALKRARPSEDGRHRYDKSDLQLRVRMP